MCISPAPTRASPVGAAVLTLTGVSHQVKAAVSRLHYGGFLFPLTDPDT